jgi:FkbM family methyltransferase
VLRKAVILPPPPLIRMCADEPAVARKSAREALGIGDTDFVFAYWGYIYPGKGLETLLEAFRIASAPHPDMRLVLVGGSLDFPKGGMSCAEYFQMVRQLPETLGIAGRVSWTGGFRWDSDAGSRFLRAADACVLPMDYGVTLNNSSLAAAGIHGVPVISTRLPAGRDEALEHGRNVYLCRPQDPEMLAEAMQVVYEADDFRERLRSGILDLAREFHDWGTMSERMLGVFRAALPDNGQPGRSSSSPPGRGTRADGPQAVEQASDEAARSSPDADRASPAAMPGEAGREAAGRPLVSVIVAVYKVDRYLAQCLDSLVNQTLKDIEIIAVDDASPDGSAAILKEYQARYPNLRVIRCEQNRGLATVRNIGMSAACGEYVAFTDGDDWADVRMCEALYERARRDDADVLVADARVFYDDSKTFAPFFDRSVRGVLDPRLRQVPFSLARDARVLLLEPVAWPKLYKRSFLQAEGIRFEDGMSSYEDICFHFWVLVKASRIALTDDAYIFYRQNRPGQISGMTHRGIFEVFEVFRKIQDNLAAWGASTDVWTMLVRVQVRQFNWLLRDRVPPSDRREFFARASGQFARIPPAALRDFARANPRESPILTSYRRNWPRAHGTLIRRRGPFYPLLYVARHERPRRVLKRALKRGLTDLPRRVASRVRSFLARGIDLSPLEERLQGLAGEVERLKRANELASEGPASFVDVRAVDGETLVFSGAPDGPGLSEAIRRVDADHYLSRTAAFREGDTVVDVGAHVGAFSLTLARKYPFLRVYAVEPDPVSFSQLTRNIELNGLTNVVAVNKALSGDGRRATLYVDPWSRAWATLDPKLAFSRDVLQSVEVDTVTLAALFREYGIGYCRLLKVTAPGAVGESLKGFPETRCVDLLCGEADLRECSLPRLEAASWRVARQHFWRTTAAPEPETAEPAEGESREAWTHQLPRGLEPPCGECPSAQVSSKGWMPFELEARHGSRPPEAATDPRVSRP